MIQTLIHRLFARRHFWRQATFSEVAELYVARMLRTFAMHMISMFLTVYMYQNGYSLLFIFIFLSLYYGAKVPVSFVAAWYTSRFGPKHAILLSNILCIPALVIFTFVPEAGVWYGPLIIGLFSIFQGVSATMYDYAYLVDFSKVKHADHAGKELGFMYIAEKAASVVAPVVGGVLAMLAGPEVVMLISAALFAVAAIPLLMTVEPIKTHQKIRWQGFPWRAVWRSPVAYTAVGFDVIATSPAWMLFLASIVFATQQNEVYASLGALMAIGMVAAFLAAFTFGKLIDKHSGGALLRYAVIAKSLTHITRPLVVSPIGAASVNIVSESAATGQNMAFLRGMFDTADASGFRLTYLLIMEMAVNAGAALACLVLSLLLALFEPQIAFMLFFVVAAGYMPLLATPRFRLYQR